MLRTDPRYRFLCLVLVTVPNMIYFAAYDPQAASSCQWIPVVAYQTKAIIGHSNSAQVAETFPLSLLHFEAICVLFASRAISAFAYLNTFYFPEDYYLAPSRATLPCPLVLPKSRTHSPFLYKTMLSVSPV